MDSPIVRSQIPRMSVIREICYLTTNLLFHIMQEVTGRSCIYPSHDATEFWALSGDLKDRACAEKTDTMAKRNDVNITNRFIIFSPFKILPHPPLPLEVILTSQCQSNTPWK